MNAALRLIATGGALPGRTVTNEDLSRMVDTSDAWITSRTGIRTRHWCTEDESAATLAISAAKQALALSAPTCTSPVPRLTKTSSMLSCQWSATCGKSPGMVQGYRLKGNRTAPCCLVSCKDA